MPVDRSIPRLLPNTAISVSKYTSLESIDENHVVLVQTAEQHRVRIKRSFYEFLRSCRDDRPISSLTGGAPPVELMRQLDRLREKGLIVAGEDDRWDRPQRLTSAVPFKMFGSPDFEEGRTADVVTLGVPYDLTDPTPSGCRLAPDKIRQRSFDFRYEIDFHSGEPRGWFDADRERRILEGIRIADVGNVVVQYGERQETLFSRIQTTIRSVMDAGAIPMTLGGDHSISVPIVASIGNSKPLTVIALSAHTQFDPDVADEIVNAASACRKMWELPHVTSMVLIGHRGYTRNPKVSTLPDNVTVVTAAKLERAGCLTEAIGAKLAGDVYLTIDANVLDPSTMPAARVLTPGGLSLPRLKDLIGEIGRHGRIVGFDFVGFDGSCSHTVLGDIVACHVMLIAAAAATGTF